MPGINVRNTVAPQDHLVIRLNSAAFRLLATQNSDGGWEWMNPDTDPSHGVPSPYNTLGVTAQALLDCYRHVPSERLLTASIATYNAMVTNSQDPNPAKHRVRGPDIPFLVELTELRGIATHANFAKTRWAAAMTEFGGGTAAGFAAYIRDVRKGQNLPALIPWDINLYIQGILALARYYPNQNYAAQAKAMAEVIYDSLYVPPVDFDITQEQENEFWAGISGVLEAFTTTGTHPTEAAALVTKLIGAQQSDGHFVGVGDGSDVQTTAYATLSLMKAKQVRAAISAIDYLGSSQLGNGGWLYDGGENTEVASEAAQAISDFLNL